MPVGTEGAGLMVNSSTHAFAMVCCSFNTLNKVSSGAEGKNSDKLCRRCCIGSRRMILTENSLRIPDDQSKAQSADDDVLLEGHQHINSVVPTTALPHMIVMIELD